MGQQWDTGETAFAVEFWAEVLRVLKPGGHLVAFSGTRTYHRLAVAIEDAGFEIRDQLAWVYGSGFPKSHDVSKGIDAIAATGRARTTDMRRVAMGEDYEPSGRGRVNFDHGGGSSMNGVLGGEPITALAREWQGWGTALKPSWEPIVLARKPLVGTVAANVLEHGTGAIHIDGCRVESYGGSTARGDEPSAASRYADRGSTNFAATPGPRGGSDKGRWPANILHDGSPEVVAAFPAGGNDSGTAARFFYSAKAGAYDRLKSKHPTVKPVDLMRWLVRLVTPPGGVTLDPFAGTGTTGAAAWLEGFSAVLIEREAEYRADIARRMDLMLAGPEERARALAEAAPHDDLPLFGGGGAPASNGKGGGVSSTGRSRPTHRADGVEEMST